MSHHRRIIIPVIILVFYLICPSSFAYSVETPNETVHQYITNESQKVWPLIPYEIKIHLKNPINRTTSDNDYNIGDDIVDGSREEDLPLRKFRFFRHFWQPDDPDTPSMTGNDDYNDGLNSPWNRQSLLFENLESDKL